MADSGFSQRLAIWIPAIFSLIAAGLTGYLSFKADELSDQTERLAVDVDRSIGEWNAQNERSRIDIERWKFLVTLRDQILEESDPKKQTFALTVARSLLSPEEFYPIEQALRQQSAEESDSTGEQTTADKVIDAAKIQEIRSLLARANGSARDDRRQATAQLVSRFAGDSDAIADAVRALSPAQLSRITVAGRINVLTFLAESEADAWNNQTRSQFRAAAANMESRHSSGVGTMGATTRAVFDKAKRTAAL